MITAAKCMTNFAQLQPWRALVSSPDLGVRLSVHYRSIMASKLALLWLPNMFEYRLPMDLYFHFLWATKHIFKQVWLWPPTKSLSSHDHGGVQQCNSHGSCREFLRISRRSVGRGWEDLKRNLAMRNHTIGVDLCRLRKCVWGATQIVLIYEHMARVRETKSGER